MRGGALSGLRNWRLRKKLIVSFDSIRVDNTVYRALRSVM